MVFRVLLVLLQHSFKDGNMIKQYPDSIVITIVIPPTKGSDGIYTEGSSTEFTSDCRAEINSSGRKTPGLDGMMLDYAYNCYMPKTTTVIPFGSKFILNGTIEGTVKGSSNGQLNSRLWL